jgi:hypothetical protein
MRRSKADRRRIEVKPMFPALASLCSAGRSGHVSLRSTQRDPTSAFMSASVPSRSMVTRTRSVAALVLVVLLAACGSGGGGQAKVEASAGGISNAIDASIAKGTAHVKVTAALDLAGKQASFGGSGDVDFANGAASLTVDLSNAATALGGSVPGILASALVDPVEVVISNGAIYVKAPAVAKIASLGGDKEWVKIGVDGDSTAASALSSLTSALGTDGNAVLEALKNATSVDDMGTETLDGVQTTHMHGSVALGDAIKPVTDALGESIGSDLPDLSMAVPFDVWVDGDGLIRKVVIEVGSDGWASSGPTMSPTGSITLELSDYGTTPDVKAPADDNTADVTKY